MLANQKLKLLYIIKIQKKDCWIEMRQEDYPPEDMAKRY